MPRIATFADIMAGHKTAEILCPRKNLLMRRLTMQPNGQIEFDCLSDVDPKLLIDPTTPVSYIPWDMDRGSMTFMHKSFGNQPLSLCTEMDIVAYPETGKRERIYPAKGGLCS